MPAPDTTNVPRRLRTASIGGATLDLFVTCDHTIVDDRSGTPVFALPLGAKIAAKNITSRCGGGASNTAVGLARLGCDAAFIGVVGDDQWGTILLENMRTEGVRTDAATIVMHEMSSFSIIFNDEDGERVIIYDAGATEHLQDATFPRDVLGSMDWVYLNHIPERGHMIHDDIIAALTAPNAPGLTWNPGGRQIAMGMKEKEIALLLKHTDLLLVNAEEARAFTGASDHNEALRLLLAAGARIVCITDGKQGAMASDGTTVVRCPMVPAPVVDTTGAGDAFGTGCTWAIATGKDLSEALLAGSINAANVVNAIGAQTNLLTDTDMGQRMQHPPVSVTTDAL